MKKNTTVKDAKPGQWFGRFTETGRNTSKVVNHVLAEDGQTLCGLYVGRPFGLNPQPAVIGRSGKLINHNCERCKRIAAKRGIVTS